MRKEAELHAEEDRQSREAVEARNEADNSVYRSEKMLKDNADKLGDAAKSQIESAINGVKESLKGNDGQAIKTATEKLNEAWQAVSAELYKAAAEKAQAGKTAGHSETQTESDAGKQDEGPIIDAEVVDDKK
jgi:molecular chaperone DnaK